MLLSLALVLVTRMKRVEVFTATPAYVFPILPPECQDLCSRNQRRFCLGRLRHGSGTAQVCSGLLRSAQICLGLLTLLIYLIRNRRRLMRGLKGPLCLGAPWLEYLLALKHLTGGKFFANYNVSVVSCSL